MTMTKSFNVPFLTLLAALFPACALLAAEYTFPTAGGDLASSTDWGLDSIPGENDTVLITQPSANYEISKDVIFGNIYFNATGEFRVSAEGVAINLNADSYPLRMIDSTKNRYIYLKGGTWDLNGKEWKGLSKNSCLYLQNGAVLTNAATAWVSSLAYTGARIYMDDASRVHCAEFRVNNASAGSGILSVAGGSKLIDAGSFYTETGTEDFSKIMNTRTTVSGVGSEIRCGSLQIGYRTSGNLVEIIDGGTIDCAAVRLCSGTKGTGDRICMSDGTLKVAGDITVNSTVIDNGNGIAATNSTIAVGGAFTVSASYASCDFQNVKFSVDGAVSLFDSTQGSTVRFGGSEGTMPAALKSVANYFTKNTDRDHTLVIDDGFAMTNNATMRMMAYSSNCTIRISNSASFTSSATLHVGDEDCGTSVNNHIEVLSGGRVEVNSFRLMGTDNGVVISNGTLWANNASDGVLLGYKYTEAAYPTSGARVVLKGSAPKLYSEGTMWMRNGTTLRFEIPVEGYASGFAPVEALQPSFDATSRLEIDYEDYLSAGGGEVTLVSFRTDVTDRTVGTQTYQQWLKSQAEAMGLPPGCKLKLVTDEFGSKIVFRAGPPLGMPLILR